MLQNFNFVIKLFKKKSAEDTLIPPLWEKLENVCFFNVSRSLQSWVSTIQSVVLTADVFHFFIKYYLFTRLHAAELVLSRWKLSERWSKTAHATIDLQSRHRINPQPTRFVSGKANECRWRPRKYQVDPWSRRREVARGVLFPKLEKRSIFCHRSGIENYCPQLSTHQRPNVIVSNAWQAPVTYHRRVVNTATRGWVGAPNERAPFRFHDAVVGFVDRCLSRTWISPLRNKHLAEFLRPTLAQHLLRRMTMETRCCQKKIDFQIPQP